VLYLFHTQFVILNEMKWSEESQKKEMPPELVLSGVEGHDKLNKKHVISSGTEKSFK
jgi:hypothetical protein